ncbi:hypothetical protein K8T06_06265 [bacterium]|nr:hypothetical protein [bacterium]
MYEFRRKRMRDLLKIIFLVSVCLLMNVISAQGRVWHVCMSCDEGDEKTIGAAIKKAKPRDTILVYWEPRFPYFMEQLTIDKPLRIISYAAAGDVADYDLYPVITATGKEIIHITVPGVELIGFNVMYLEKPENPDSDNEFDGRVGIRLSAPALIRYCAITNCSTGILTEYNTSNPPTGSRIQMCRIGLPADHGLDRQGLSQTRNLFGMVLLGSRKTGPELGRGSDKIADCQIMRNTKYGIVYTPLNQPFMEQNLIELNGLGPYRVALPKLGKKNKLIWAGIKPAEPSETKRPDK